MGINFDEDSVKYVSKHVGLISVSIDYYTYTYEGLIIIVMQVQIFIIWINIFQLLKALCV